VSWRAFWSLLFLGLSLSAAYGCRTVPPPQSPAFYYLTSEIAYLRDRAGYEGNVLAQLYKGDQVERLEMEDSGWWRVQPSRTGQAGWLQGDLLSPTPVAVALWVMLKTVPLRECPQEACPTLQLLYRGDRVQKIEQNSQGWWRVLPANTRILGWVPAAALADRLPPPPTAQRPGKTSPYAYVVVRQLRLRAQPLEKAKVIKHMALNDQVERLEQGPQGWVKVRHVASGAVGWVAGRYLETLPALAPLAPKPGSKPPEKKGQAPPEPEAM
jgi:uncharacterized protein YgiM (DUF1202 family)